MGFEKMRKRLSDRDGDRLLMQMSQESKKEDISKNPSDHFRRSKRMGRIGDFDENRPKSRRSGNGPR